MKTWVSKGIDGKSIVLGRDGEAPLPRPRAQVALLRQSDQLLHLPGVGEEFPPLQRQGNTSRRTAKERDDELVLQVVNGFGEAGLRDVEALGTLADGAGVGNSGDVSDLLKCHGETGA